MRNLKKLLALVLALVMTMSLVAVANAADYKDVDAGDDHAEAIDVMSAIGVIGGYPDGSFKPENTLTRAEGAKIVAYMLLGDAVDDLPASATFADVPANHWASAPIAYLKNEGIVSGRNATTFDPDAKLSGYEFAKMLLTALGYSSAQEGFTGASWAVNVAKLAATTGINDKAAMNGSALLRGDAAQMSFNTLTADVVEYAGNTTVTTGDVTVSISGKAAKVAIDREGTDNYAGDGGDGANYQQFCEKYFKGLTANNPDATDDFGRPGNAWEYKKASVAFEAKDADYTYVVKDSGKTVKDFVKDVMKRDITAATKVYVNGDDSSFAFTRGTIKVGSTIEFYMKDGDVKTADAVVIVTPKVVTLTADAETKVDGDKTQVKVPGVSGMSGFSDKYTTDNVSGYEGLKKDDVVLVASANADTTNDPTVIITKAESVSGTATSQKNGTDIVVNGTAYKGSELDGQTYATDYKFADNHNDEFEFYLDAAGAIVKAKLVEEGGEKNYAYVLETAFKGKGADTLDSKDAAQARLLFPDGSTEVVSVSKVDGSDPDTGGMNSSSGTVKANFVTYKEKSDGTYELTKTGVNTTAGSAGDSIVKGQAKFLETASGHVAANLVGNNNTVFLVNTGSASDPTINVYTGINNIPNIKNISAASTDVKANVDEGVCKYVYILAPKSGVEGEAGQYVYIPANDNGGYDYEAIPATDDSAAYREVTAIVNGESQTIKLKADGTGAWTSSTTYDTAVAAKTMYKVNKVDDDGIMTELDTAAHSISELTKKTGIQYSGGIIQTAYASGAWGESYQTNDSTEVYFIDGDGNVSKLAPSSISKDTNNEVYILKTSDSGKVVDLVYIVDYVSSELGIKSIKYNVQDGSDNTENSVNDPTVSGTTQTITTGISESGKTITIKEVVLKDAEHAVVDYNKTTCTAAESSSGDEAAQIIFTVTAEDGTIGTLTVTFETAG